MSRLIRTCHFPYYRCENLKKLFRNLCRVAAKSNFQVFQNNRHPFKLKTSQQSYIHGQYLPRKVSICTTPRSRVDFPECTLRPNVSRDADDGPSSEENSSTRLKCTCQEIRIAVEVQIRPSAEAVPEGLDVVVLSTN